MAYSGMNFIRAFTIAQRTRPIAMNFITLPASIHYHNTIKKIVYGYTAHWASSIFCSLKRTSSALSYFLLQLTQYLASLYIDRNVSVDRQRGQFVFLGFDSNVKNIINSLMVYVIVFPYRYNCLLSKDAVLSFAILAINVCLSASHLASSS